MLSRYHTFHEAILGISNLIFTTVLPELSFLLCKRAGRGWDGHSNVPEITEQSWDLNPGVPDLLFLLHAWVCVRRARERFAPSAMLIVDGGASSSKWIWVHVFSISGKRDLFPRRKRTAFHFKADSDEELAAHAAAWVPPLRSQNTCSSRVTSVPENVEVTHASECESTFHSSVRYNLSF